MVRKDMILLVEDNPDDEALALRALKKTNIVVDVVVARDGLEALDILLCRGDYESSAENPPPQVVLLDLKLPKVDGLSVLQQMRSHDRTRLTPVVILTSSVEEQDLIAGYSSGANSYIRKPVDFAQFTESVRHLGRYWLELNEAPPDRWWPIRRAAS